MKNEKDLLGGVIIITLLLLVLVTYMSFYNYKKIENISSFEDNSLMSIYIYDDFTYKKIGNSSNFDNKVVLGSYNCKVDNCMVYTDNNINSIYDDRYVVIKENNKVFIYDFKLNKVVSDLYESLIEFSSYFVVKKDYKYGIISKNGVSITESIYDKIEIDSIYESYIKVSNNNLFGILDLDNGNIILETKYQDIKISDTKYYAIFQDGLWYVIDSDGNTITNGYNYIFAFNKGFITLIDNELCILKYNKEKDELLNDNKIVILESDNYSITRVGNTINIIINDNIEYQYNIGRNNLIKKSS